MFFWQKQKMIIKMIDDYIESVYLCLDTFSSGYEVLISGAGDDLKKIVESIHSLESKADDLRREIELRLYQDALIPESRGDILGLLQTLDKIPNSYNDISYKILLQKMIIPEELRPEFNSFKDKNLEACKILLDAVKGLFSNFDVMDKIDQIDTIESCCDRLEHDLIDRVFSFDCDKADRLLYSHHIENMGQIANKAQSVAYRLRLAIIKRRI